MHNNTRRSLLALGGTTATLAAMLVPAPAHAAGTHHHITLDGDGPITIMGGCGDIFSVEVPDGLHIVATAHWELTCANGQITMAGWVDDKRSDGKCAYVRGEFNTAVELAKNCPADSPRTEFKWTHSGSIVDGYAFVRG